MAVTAEASTGPGRTPAGTLGVPQLRTILLTDLVESTALVEKIGDTAAARLFRAHDHLVLELQERWRGRLIDRSDGMLLLFERPIDGLGFALDYVRGLREVGAAHKVDLKARAGLHVGEVLTWRNSDQAVRVGAKPVEVEGLAKPMAARLLGMARPGQILLSSVAEPLAHRAARELGERGLHLAWKSWGRWRFKGMPEAQEVFEVGEPDLAPLRTPVRSQKAWRDLPLWRRPAALAIQAVLVLAVVGAAWLSTRPQPAIAFSERDWVVLADVRNLTGEPLLDDSLEVAFRVSLEQSRHVNVLGDLKVRQTLGNMRLPADTLLDRSVAAEVAIREGAKAVILPTVAEVHGRVRVTAEIVEPTSEAAVWVGHADGAGAESTLDSIDTVVAALRSGLGETGPMLARDAQPLPRVATSSLDALKAYALGLEAYRVAKYDLALQHFQRAIELDPEFALAYVGVVRVHVSTVEASQAEEYLLRAAALRGNLAPREALYLDAWVEEFSGTPVTRAAAWKLLGETYPDYFAAHHNYSWIMFETGNLDEALAVISRVDHPSNPLRHSSLDLKGRIQLALGDGDAGLRTLRKAAELRGEPPGRRVASALASLGRVGDAETVLDAAARAPGGLGALNDFEGVAIKLAAGRLESASATAERALARSDGASQLTMGVLKLQALLAMALHNPDEVDHDGIRALASEAVAMATNGTAASRADLVALALAAVRLGQRVDDHAAMAPLVEQLHGPVQLTGQPMLEKLHDTVAAEQLRVGGKPGEALAVLDPRIDAPRPYQWHVVHAAVLRDLEDPAADKERAWLRGNPGWAWTEPYGGQAFLTMNVVDLRDAQQG